MAPRKVRYVMEPVRNRTVADALNTLGAMNRRAAKAVAKAIGSAFANARQADPTLTEEQTVIKRLFADGGPTWKRHRAAAFGRAVMIHKRTSHITVELDRLDGVQPASPPPAAQPGKAKIARPAPPAKRAAGKTRGTRKAAAKPKPSAARPKKQRAAGRNPS